MSMPHHVVWDWNGTLFDDLDARIAGMNTLCEKFGAPPIGREEFQRHHARPAKRFYENTIGRSLSEHELLWCETAFLEHYADAKEQARLHPKGMELMTFIRDQGTTQSILSMWQHSQLEPFAERLGVSAFCLRVDGVDDLLGSPKADYLTRHLDRLEAKTSRSFRGETTLVIGDVVDDGDAAAANGVRSSLVATGAESFDALRASGYPAFQTLENAIYAAFA
jgi:phosphoglycolate phosphatase-like HAD superfamily hydrolase